MRRHGLRVLSIALALVAGLRAQVPLNALSIPNRIAAQDILNRVDFTFETRTAPKKVRVAMVERLFDRPRLSAAMWRMCQFVPTFYAFEMPDQAFYVTDTHGLHGTMTLVLKRPGYRVYLVDGRVETGRMKNPFPVGAKMITVYRYWDGPKGFETHLQTWTALDSALLGFLSRPFRKYLQHRQEEFIAYINGNIAQGAEFAESSPQEFREPIHREGDPVAIRQFEEAFGK
jgi:hypothetical protein